MENFKREYGTEKKEKPDVLYIAAHLPEVPKLVPIVGNYRDENEGAVIFSTPDKALASVFLVEGHSDSWMQIGFYGDVLAAVINADRDDFIRKDKGGIIYTSSSDTFNYHPDKGMGEKEWTSRESVKPLSETMYSSALDLMIENGVQVYFVDKKTFDDINKSDDHGCGILNHIQSENQRRNKNIKVLEDVI